VRYRRSAKREPVTRSPRDATPPVAVFDNYWATTLAFARSLGSRGVPLHFYGNGAGRWSRYCSRRARCPPTENADEFQPWLREQVRSGEITRVAPTTDLIAFCVSVLRDEFPPEVQRTIAPLPEIENCLIKTRFAAVSAAAGHPPLASSAPDSVEGAVAAARVLGYPVMLKPKSHLAVGFGERGRLLLNEADLLRHYRQYAVTPGQQGIAAAYPELLWPLLQRYLPSARNRVYSVSGIKDADGGILTACVSYKREQWPPDVGVSTVQVGCEDSRVLDAGLRIVNQLLSRGIFEVELLADGDALYAIDLNPRAFGFLELDIARGFDLPWLWFRSTLEPQTPAWAPQPQVSIEAHHRIMRVIRLMGRATGRLSAPAVEERRDSKRSRRFVYMVGSWSDPLPMIVSYWHALRHPRSFLRSQFAPFHTARPS
jgi:predicted ATP-grasp superfamily ATP-dependent carboligase